MARTATHTAQGKPRCVAKTTGGGSRCCRPQTVNGYCRQHSEMAKSLADQALSKFRPEP